MPTMPSSTALHRRRLLGHAALLLPTPLLALAGCASPWPEVPAGAGSSSARQRLQEAAEAHGLPAWQTLQDANLGFDRLAWPAAPGLQPVGPAQLRLMPAGGLAALQAAQGDPGARPLATALHRLLVLGPLALHGFTGAVNWAEPVTLQGRRCDHLHLQLAPGLGAAASDRLSLFIDREQGWLRRLQLSLQALDASALVQVDLTGHRRLHGVLWPLRFASVAGAPLAWQLTGLDVNRGYPASALLATPWAGRAVAPAAALPPA
ncbi:MAG: hypothetical protein V4795_14360 [Pseudomonadota bacterium]